MTIFLSPRPRLARASLACGLLLGVLADLLLRQTPWGLNFTLWVAGLAAVVAVLARHRNGGSTPTQRLLLAVTLFFAAAASWRDSDTLVFFDVIATLLLLCLVSLSVLEPRLWALWTSRIRDYFRAGVHSAISAGFGAIPLVGRDASLTLGGEGRLRRMAIVARGLALAIPAMLIFGGLFAAADPVYEKLANRLFAWDLGTMVSHVVFAGFFAWITAGYLRGTILSTDGGTYGTDISGPTLGIGEIGIVLGALDLLFLSFVAVQLRYFFGGSALVHSTAGLTYAEYARRGFFELVTVAALTLPVLLLAHELLRKEEPAARRAFVWLAGGLVTLLFVVMASAARRMQLYQAEYGLTEDRLYSSVLMGWLGIVLVWFAATMLRGRPAHFAAGALVSGFGVLAALNIANPDAIITRVNLARLDSGRRFDAAYLWLLSADAIPTLVSAPPVVRAPVSGCEVAVHWRLHRLRAAARADWRSWNYSRARAAHALRSSGVDRSLAACPPTQTGRSEPD